jgi:hypothetical protein
MPTDITLKKRKKKSRGRRGDDMPSSAPASQELPSSPSSSPSASSDDDEPRTARRRTVMTASPKPMTPAKKKVTASDGVLYTQAYFVEHNRKNPQNLMKKIKSLHTAIKKAEDEADAADDEYENTAYYLEKELLPSLSAQAHAHLSNVIKILDTMYNKSDFGASPLIPPAPRYFLLIPFPSCAVRGLKDHAQVETDDGDMLDIPKAVASCLRNLADVISTEKKDTEELRRQLDNSCIFMDNWDYLPDAVNKKVKNERFQVEIAAVF